MYIVAAIVAVALAAPFIVQKYAPGPASPAGGKLVTGSATETFSGTITAVDTGCFYDATCSVSVDGKKIILITGGRSMSPDVKVGRLIGVDSVGDLEQKIGAHANVYATTTAEGDWSLYGNENYYVEVVTLKN